MKALATALLLTVAVLVPDGFAEVPTGYPRSYKKTIEAAKDEGELLIYSATDEEQMIDLLADFHALYPGIAVEYLDITSTEIYNRVVEEVNDKSGTADLLWSSAMDLQIKLVNDGYAQPYASPEKPNLPEWAVWKNEAYGVTAEPIIFAYNQNLLPSNKVPKTHADLIALLRQEPATFRGKVAAYDPIHSGVGYLYLSQDMRANRDTWDLMRALTSVETRYYASTLEMVEKLASGEHVLAYNLIGSYAFARQEQHPELAVVIPSDYTLVMSRIALIPAEARHPNAARLFLDFLLSKRGQAHLARRHMAPVRADVPAPDDARPSAEQAHAIRVGPMLLANLDQARRARFVKDWNKLLAKD